VKQSRLAYVAYVIALGLAAGFIGACGGGGTGGHLTATVPTPVGPSPIVSGPSFVVDASAARHPISPDIYGITFWFNGPHAAAQKAFAQSIGLPVNRLGGDATTRYNWQFDSSNAGRDWYFVAGNGQSSAIPSASIDAIIAQDITTHTKTIVTIPMIEYINNASAWHCSFPESTYGAQTSYDPYLHPGGDNCGNGVKAGGGLIPQESPIITDMLNSPGIQSAWIGHLVSRFGSAAHGGVPIYEMDNEPSGWQAIHRDVHPAVSTCSELQSQTLAYAPVIKAADPTASILGPDDIPAADVLSCSGVTGRGLWYLQLMATYQQLHGVRILDYFGLHYPGWGAGDPIANAVTHVKLHQGWIASAYPGTKLAYDEYNWGDATAFPDALMAADGLGLFGQIGVDLASFWGLDDPSTAPTASAFLLYRNYDGKGSRFGDVSIQVGPNKAPPLEIYAAQRSLDNAITVVVVNRQGASVSATLVLRNANPATAQVYRFSQAATTIARQPDQAMDGSTMLLTYPGNSASLIVIP